MPLIAILFLIVFASTACTQPLSKLEKRDYELNSLSTHQRHGESLSLASHESSNVLVQSDSHDLAPLIPKSKSCGVKEAWEHQGKIIHYWPDVDAAYETKFEGRPAVVTQETVPLVGNRRLLSNDINALKLTGQLYGYATRRTSLRTTYYIVHKRMGDSWEKASRNGLSALQMVPLIRHAKDRARDIYKIYPGGCATKCDHGDQTLYAFVKDYVKNEYVRAVPISWKKASLVLSGKLRKFNVPSDASYCVETWD